MHKTTDALPKGKDVRLNIRLTRQQHEQLSSEADAQGRSIAEVVRRALGLKKPEKKS